MINSQKIQVREIGWTNQAGAGRDKFKTRKTRKLLGHRHVKNWQARKVTKRKQLLGKKIVSNQTRNWKNILGLMRQKIKAGWLTNGKQCTWPKTNHVYRKAWWWQHHALEVLHSSRPLKGCGGNTSRKYHQFPENNLNHSAPTLRMQTQATQKLFKDSKWLLERGHVNAQISI